MASRKAPKQAAPKMTYEKYRSIRQRAGMERTPKVTRPLPPEPVATPFVAKKAPSHIERMIRAFGMGERNDTRPRVSKTPVRNRIVDAEIQRQQTGHTVFKGNIRGGKAGPPQKPKKPPADTRRMGASIAQLRELETEKTYFAREHDRAGRAGDVSTQRHYLHAYADAERRYLEHAQKHRHEYGTLAGTDPNEGKYRNRAPLGIAPRGNTFKPSQETMAARRATHVPKDK